MPNDELFVSAVDTAYEAIKTRILKGELRPGQQLSKRKMAELTGVSVIPVIEALNRLTEDGLVESRPRWGSFVAIYTPEKIEDLFVLREALECQVARVLARTMTPAQYAECLPWANRLDSAKHTGVDSRELCQWHYAFHTKLAEAAGYPSVCQALKRCNLIWMLHSAEQVGKQRQTLPDDWHKRLLDAFMERDPDRAEKAMRLHVTDSLQMILDAHR